MKIKPIDYILHCKVCGKTHTEKIRKLFVKKVKGKKVQITTTVSNCPYCRKDQEVKIIGTVKVFDEFGFEADEGAITKVQYTFKPVKVDGVWTYEELAVKPKAPEDDSSKSWKAKQAQWEEEETLMSQMEKEEEKVTA